jgi:hypothetical protein
MDQRAYYQATLLASLEQRRRPPERAHLLAYNRRPRALPRRLARTAGRSLLVVGLKLLAYSGLSVVVREANPFGATLSPEME